MSPKARRRRHVSYSSPSPVTTPSPSPIPVTDSEHDTLILSSDEESDHMLELHTPDQDADQNLEKSSFAGSDKYLSDEEVGNPHFQ